MSKSSNPVNRMAAPTQTLSTSYGAAIVIPVGAINPIADLDDTAIAFTVQDQGTNTPEEAVPAGSAWSGGNVERTLGRAVTIKVKAASGTPNLNVIWFEETQP